MLDRLGESRKGNHRRWTVGILAVLIVLCSGSAGLYLIARDIYSERQVRQLIQAGYTSQRPGGGRLSGTSYVPVASKSSTPLELGRAQVFLLRHPDISDRQRLQGMIYMATADWRAYIENSKAADN